MATHRRPSSSRGLKLRSVLVLVAVIIGCVAIPATASADDASAESVVTPNPQASISSVCGAASVSVSNVPVNDYAPTPDTVGGSVTLTIQVEGVVRDTVTLASGEIKGPYDYVFDEDSGDYLVQVFNGASALDAGTIVGSNCDADRVASNPNFDALCRCGSIELAFMNFVELSNNEFALDVDFHYTDADGAVQTVTVAPNGEPVVRTVSFPEDSGDHVVKAWIAVGESEPTEYTVVTDCLPPVVTPPVVVPPVETAPVVTPPAVVTPVVTAPVIPVSVNRPLPVVLPTTGIEATAPLLAAVGLILVGAIFYAGMRIISRRRKTASVEK